METRPRKEQGVALGLAAQWAHLRKLCTRLGTSYPPAADRPQYAAQQGVAADRYVKRLTADVTNAFEAFPDRAEAGATIVWRDTWIGKAEVGSDGRPGHRIRSSTPEGRRCSFWVADEHCVGSTGVTELSGRKHRTVIALVVNVGDDSIDLDPIAIGHLIRLGEDLFAGVVANELQVHVSAIDQFSALSSAERASAADLETVSNMSETKVKHAFARIIGEPFVPKDWGGERSDLNTARITIEGVPAEASFVLKGPAAPQKMVIGTLGANGDQVDRALTERPDLIVVQHYGSIDATVRHMLERYCFHETYARHNRTRWTVLDGASTAQILRAYGELGS